MSRKFVTNLIFLLFLNFLVKPFYILGIDAEVQNRVGKEEYGMYFSLLGFTFLFNILLDVGIINFNTRTISQQPFLLKKYFSKIVTARILMALIYGIFLLILGVIIGYNSVEVYMLIWLIANQVIASFTLYFRSNIAGLMLFKYDSVISVMDRFLLVIICSVLLWGGVTGDSFDIFWFIYAQTFAYGCTALFALYVLLSKQKVKRMNWDKLFSIAILKQSIPYALLILLMTFYYRVDSVMLERMLEDGKTQAGIYAQGFRFFEAGNNIAFLFASLLLPLFSSLIKNKKSVLNLVQVSSRILIPGVILVALICFFYSQELIEARYVSSTTQSGEVFGILMLCFVFISSTYIFGTLLTANGDLRTLNKIAFAGVVLNVILNLILIPIYKAYGAALASLITQALTAIAQIILCKKIFNLKINKNSLMRFVLFIINILIVLFSFKFYFNDFFSWKIAVLFTFTTGVIFLFVFKLINIKNIKSILLSK